MFFNDENEVSPARAAINEFACKSTARAAVSRRKHGVINFVDVALARHSSNKFDSALA